MEIGCFRKCHFGIPRNTEFYTELVLFRVIPQNFLLFNSAEFRGIPYRFVYTEFRIPSSLAIAYCIMQPGVKSKDEGGKPPFHTYRHFFHPEAQYRTKTPWALKGTIR